MTATAWAKSAFLASLPVLRKLGWRSTAADALVGLADALRDQGNYGEAAEMYREAVILYRQVGHHRVSAVARTLCTMAEMELQECDWAAGIHAVETLVAARDTGEVGRSEIGRALVVRAELLAAQGSPMEAWRLAGAAAALHHSRGLHNSPSGPAAGERRVSYLPPSPQVSDGVSDQRASYARLRLPRDLLNADEEAVAWAEGLAMSPDEAIVSALG